MITLTAQSREITGKKVKALRTQGLVPATLYGPNTEALSVQIGEKEFEKVYAEAGESTLVSLSVEGKDSAPVLIYDVKRNPLSGKVLHTDLYQTPLDKPIEISVPLIFEGEAPAVSELEGTLVKNIQEIEVKALPQELPSEIVVNVESLATFEDRITVGDLVKADNVEIVREADEIIAQVVPVTIEEEPEPEVPEGEEGAEGEATEGEEGEGTEESKEEAPQEESKEE